MFAKYAFPPNLLQFCGPAESGSVFSVLTESKHSEKIRDLFSKFYCAVPYLQLIAGCNGVKDAFDRRVVEAYWLGNGFLNKVAAGRIYSHAENRFKKEMSKKDWFWLVEGSIPGAKPFHGFHVFDIYRRDGVPEKSDWNGAVKNMDMCRVAWGRVESIGPGRENKKKPSFGMALVKYNPLEFDGRKMRLGGEKTRESFLLDHTIKPGDEVSLHWDYICDRITARQKNNLVYWTNYHLALANKTI